MRFTLLVAATLTTLLASSTETSLAEGRHKQFPEVAKAAYQIGRQLQAKRRYPEALDHYDLATELGLESGPEFKVARGECCLKIQDYNLSAALFTLVIKETTLAPDTRPLLCRDRKRGRSSNKRCIIKGV